MMMIMMIMILMMTIMMMTIMMMTIMMMTIMMMTIMMMMIMTMTTALVHLEIRIWVDETPPLVMFADQHIPEMIMMMMTKL